MGGGVRLSLDRVCSQWFLAGRAFDRMGNPPSVATCEDQRAQPLRRPPKRKRTLPLPDFKASQLCLSRQISDRIGMRSSGEPSRCADAPRGAAGVRSIRFTSQAPILCLLSMVAREEGASIAETGQDSWTDPLRRLFGTIGLAGPTHESWVDHWIDPIRLPFTDVSCPPGYPQTSSLQRGKSGNIFI